MEAVMTRVAPEEDIQVCGLEGCTMQAAYALVKMKDDDSQQSEYFCEMHGVEFATRAHLVISPGS